MTTRERLEHKLEKRREWADSAREKGSAEFSAAHAITEHIPFGQPILVGHHSEAGHRRALERSASHMDKGCEAFDKAEYHESKARGLEARLNNTVFSDDEDAVERLEERVAARRDLQEKFKRINKIIRSKITPAEKIKEILLVGVIDEPTVWNLVENDRPLPSYMLTNNNGEIRRLEGRIAEIKRRAERQAEAEQSENGVIAKYSDYGYMTVAFAEKPDYDIIRALKAAGFYWSRGAWHGEKAKLPECVRELLPAESEVAHD